MSQFKLLRKGCCSTRLLSRLIYMLRQHIFLDIWFLNVNFIFVVQTTLTEQGIRTESMACE